MTTYTHREVTCSHCGAQSSHPALGSTNEFGSPDLDLRPPQMMRGTMNVWLQECPTCGLVAPSLDDEWIDDKDILKSADYLLVRSDSSLPPLARRFKCEAIIAEAQSKPELAFGHILSAAWVADDAGLADLARAYRLKASAILERQPELNLNRKVQLLDVVRRAGAWDAANTLVAELVAEDLDKQLVHIVAFQTTLIERRDESCYLVSDAIPAPKEPPKHKAAVPPTSLAARLRHWMGWDR